MYPDLRLGASEVMYKPRRERKGNGGGKIIEKSLLLIKKEMYGFPKNNKTQHRRKIAFEIYPLRIAGCNAKGSISHHLSMRL